MTEAEWLTCNLSVAMLGYLKGKAITTPRKLFLFTCASLRRIFSDQPPLLHSLDVAERFLEGSATDGERRSAILDVPPPVREWRGYERQSNNLVRHCLTASLTGPGARNEWWDYASCAAMCSPPHLEAGARSAALLREIFPSPLIRRVPRVPASWRNSEGAIFRLAQVAHADRAFDRLPILADALEEAGCANADILNHCRQPGEHVRGCWVVDLLLGKE